MNIKIKKDILTIVLLVFVPVFLWSLTFPSTTIKHNAYPLFVYGSQLSAIIGYSLFALSFILSTRIKPIEQYFGGLDKLYQLHHSIGKIAFFMLLIHPVLLAIRWIPDDIEKTLWYLLPFHRKMEINYGSWSLLGLSILIIFTIVIKLPYDKWKITHKFMGLFFILGIIHSFKINNFMEDNIALAIYLLLLSALALLAFLYKAVFHAWIVNKHIFKVDKIDKLSAHAMEISLSPKTKMFRFIPGQFCFFKFDDNGISKESHPFTICSVVQDNNIVILVKALGDYTNNLFKQLKVNTTAQLEGPYGCFSYLQGKPKQIWIGGGVGIAPFISWIRNLRASAPNELEIDLYYCVKNNLEAFHLQEFIDAEQALNKFCVHLICSEEMGHLKGSDFQNIENKTIFICGPENLRNALLKDFKAMKVPSKDIFYEDFDFL